MLVVLLDPILYSLNKEGYDTLHSRADLRVLPVYLCEMRTKENMSPIRFTGDINNIFNKMELASRIERFVEQISPTEPIKVICSTYMADGTPTCIAEMVKSLLTEKGWTVIHPIENKIS